MDWKIWKAGRRGGFVKIYDYYSIYILNTICFKYAFYYNIIYLKPIVQYCNKKSYLENF